MKTIPQVRTELTELASNLRSEGNRGTAIRINNLVKHMFRRPSVRRAAKESVVFTPAVAREIRSYAAAHPASSYKRMAARFNVTIGRVSEALAGRRAA